MDRVGVLQQRQVVAVEVAAAPLALPGPALEGPGRGLAALPIPISTPGFDAAPYLTATCVITRDPDTGVQNIGTYRGHLKAPTRLGMMTLVSLAAFPLLALIRSSKAQAPSREAAHAVMD